MKNLVLLTGAGISAESGIKTFRDGNGLWENHDVMEVASINGWYQNPSLVLDFYNQRRSQAETVQPNAAHQFLADLQNQYHVQIVTQNVDNLHERAGAKNVTHLHGKLSEAKSEIDSNYVVDISGKEIKLGDVCPKGYQLRPNIVWFGEEVPMLEKAAKICESADIFVIIGTSLQVYPAAGLIHNVPNNCPVFIIDPKVDEINVPNHFTSIKATAVEGIKVLKQYLK
ncbi:SIR2 family NAD-dependent protein deacylase [Wenyingzhuangia marina]|uniref:protein acetyllysine N-acetyltransferase n=1 Tax=Wenyingzhuangia marina TaxID=1195760 RepID=A0A1M5ULN2_9FLAO|nr:Sir2 family NAD-dependent protein deacetylase [Wenyingzhuangia marina]GGF66959.1 NAD-dependent protein deacylase [Wenyingzhuangia marina]SHH63840.1 NAD-dependent deacetylase [Wenyingzhuangia marina]